MADMTLSWARLRWPRSSFRQAGPAVRKISATSRSGRIAPPLGRSLALDRADHLAQHLGSHVRVHRGGVDLLVPEQHLDDADVLLLFQQVRSKAVPQGMHRDALVDPGALGGSVDRAVQLPRGHWIDAVLAREQPSPIDHQFLAARIAPPGAQPLRLSGFLCDPSRLINGSCQTDRRTGSRIELAPRAR